MKSSSNHFSENPEIEREAANWTLRLDRGLTAEEQDVYSQWVAEDASHREVIAMYRWGWDEFDRLAGLQATQNAQVDPDLLAPGNRFARKSRVLKVLFTVLPLAASVAIVAILFWSNRSPEPSSFVSKSAIELIAPMKQRKLADGSTIELNRGTVVNEAYTAEFRRVVLVRGEANFNVAKDPSRPFVVDVAGVDVRAVGTQFNIRLSSGTVDVIVSEGVVSLSSPELFEKNEGVFEEPLLKVGHRAVMTLGDAPELRVTQLTPAEMDHELRWRPRMFDFDDMPLSQVLSEFNLRNDVQLVLGDASLEDIHLSQIFRSDNVEGFVRLMEKNFDMRAEWRGSSEIVLRDAKKTGY